METPWKDKGEKPWLKQERREGKKAGARPQLNSGRTWSGLLDVKRKISELFGSLLIDTKTTQARSYSISLDGKDGWKALKIAANRTGCVPALQIDLPEASLMVIELELWDEIQKYMLAVEVEDDV